MRQKREGSQEMMLSGHLSPPGETVGASAEHTSESAPTQGERAGYLHSNCGRSNADSFGDINCPVFLGCLVGNKAGPRGKRRPRAKRSAVGSLAESTDLIKVRYGLRPAEAARY